MAKVVLYIAVSLDGYIAKTDGSIDWLPDPFQEDYGYDDLYSSVGITIMGNETYKQVLTFGDFPYRDKKNYVLTRNTEISEDQNVAFLSGNFIPLLKYMKANEKEDIWLIGGGEVIDIFMKEKLVDEIILTVCPSILGEGIPLFRSGIGESQLKLIDSSSYKSGAVQMYYEVIS